MCLARSARHTPRVTERTSPSESPNVSCQWCGTVAPAGASTCGGCGAALGQREDLGGVVIPGVTSVDPALVAYDAQPLRIPGAVGSPINPLAIK